LTASSVVAEGSDGKKPRKSHTRKRERGKWAMVACFDARLGNGIYTSRWE